MVRAKIIPKHLADIFHLPEKKLGDKQKNHRVVTTARVIASDEHLKILEDKIETENRKEQEKQERKEQREMKRKEKERLQKEKEERKKNGKEKKIIRKRKKVVASCSEESECEDNVICSEESNGEEEESRYTKRSKRNPSRRSGKRFRIALKQILHDDSSEESESCSSDDERTDPNNMCGECKKKYPPHTKVHDVDWVQCDQCDKWFHINCVNMADYGDKFLCKFCI